MVEQTTGLYNRLFEVRLLHHYWLDDGATTFDGLAAGVQAERLLTYDSRAFFSVAPTPSTQKRLDRLRAVFRQTAQGFIVATPDGATVTAKTQLSFVVSVVDGQVFDYTALTFRPWPIVEAFDPSDNTPARIVYRYKQNVPVLSNLTGATRGGGANAALFLSRDYLAPTPNDEVEALVLSGTALVQLTGDSPGAATQQLGADATTLPVYVNQSDAPAITPPAGVTGAPARGVQLSDDVADNVFALIYLTAVRGDNDAFSFVDGAGLAKKPAPVYQVRFKNRSTLWTYFDKQNGTVSGTEAQPLPLTYFGNAGSRQKPSRGVVKANLSGAKITQLVSEIYI